MKRSPLPITTRVRRTLARADNERARLGAPTLTPHHVLWALFLEGGTISSSVLRRLSFDPAIITQRLGSEWHATGSARRPFGEATLYAKATEVAAGLGHSCIDTAHLLLAVLNEESRATKLMRGSGVTFAAAQQATADVWAQVVR